MFRKKLLTFIRPPENDGYGVYDPLDLRLSIDFVLQSFKET